jgi:solute carrier family 39 (zinc transporter), member 1/2/3
MFLLLVFALATPLGIGLGLAISTANNLVEIIFNSFAAGTFIYIAASEVVVEEFSLTGNRWLKMGFFVLGATTITMMWIIE